MAEAYKCDICGNFYIRNRENTTGWNSEKQMAMDLSKVTMVTTYVLIVRALSSI